MSFRDYPLPRVYPYRPCEGVLFYVSSIPFQCHPICIYSTMFDVSLLSWLFAFTTLFVQGYTWGTPIWGCKCVRQQLHMHILEENLDVTDTE